MPETRERIAYLIRSAAWTTPLRRREEAAALADQILEVLATPADDGTTRWYCEHGCGCVLDSRSARYHECRVINGGELRDRVENILEYVYAAGVTAADVADDSPAYDPLTIGEAADRILALLSGTPQVEGEEWAAIRQALEVLEDAPGINPINYDHDDVVELDVAADEATSILRAALRSAPSVEEEGEAQRQLYRARAALGAKLSASGCYGDGDAVCGDSFDDLSDWCIPCLAQELLSAAPVPAREGEGLRQRMEDDASAARIRVPGRSPLSDLLRAADDAYNILDGVASPIDDPGEWRRDVQHRLRTATARLRGEGGGDE